ncbi:MAG: hypothetical protein GAK37_02454 [Pseudomonas sp.]|nr:MAG: hypothetical protein GAK37_02454 [Pseudomonas sp.]
MEIGKLRTTRERLLTLRHTKADAADVYGETVARSADFLLNLDRWKNHPVNTAAEQLAMAPPEVPSHEEAVASIIGGYSVGAPYDLDIDSLG